MLHKLLYAAAVATVWAPTVLARGCLEDLYICPNGQGVARDPNNNCRFFPCRNATDTTPAPPTTEPARTTMIPTTAPEPTATSNITVHKGIGTDDVPPAHRNWTAIDSSMPPALHQLLNASFGNYKAACDPLNVTVASAEKANTTTNATAVALYHLVIDVQCSTTAHVFVLQVTHDREGLYLSQCGHRENGTTRNWLTIESEMTKCQTPAQRRAFLTQPFNHANHTAQAEVSLMQNIEHFFQTPDVPVVGGAIVGVLVVLLVGVVVVHRARRQHSADRSVLAEVDEAHEEHKQHEAAAVDEDAPITNPLESTTAAPRPKDNDDGVLSSVKLIAMNQCKADVKQCKDRESGEVFELARDPKKDCAFPRCPPNAAPVTSEPAPTRQEAAQGPVEADSVDEEEVMEESADEEITEEATETPSTVPTPAQTPAPTHTPTLPLTEAPTTATTPALTPAPTQSSTKAATRPPTPSPTNAPTPSPTNAPTPPPTNSPTQLPTKAPTQAPTKTLTQAPTDGPTQAPTDAPTQTPTQAPTHATTVPTTVVTTAKPALRHGSAASESWVNVDGAYPPPLDAAIAAAFAGYNSSSVCDALAVTALSYEQQASTYSVVADVRCDLAAESQVAGKYVLHFEEPAPGSFYLSMCGHEQDNMLFNWIGVVNGNTVCQTPPEKNQFALQALEHVAHNGTTTTTTSALADPVGYLKSLDTTSLAVVGGVAAAVAIVAVLLVARLVKSRRGRYEAAASATPVRRRRASTAEECKEEELMETASTRSAIAEIEGLMEPTTTMSLRPSMKLDTPLHPRNNKAAPDAVFTIE
ncbi:mucin-5AC-like [Achlya hypogyna]|uniref:Mucin-5AC-like n=1 Tax=Achlya hypogyna TaxID=1202772 RepID=A0A1V9YCE4_ACHHY|nr:mucin-5AC-like [Achlya hypogyna]